MLQLVIPGYNDRVFIQHSFLLKKGLNCRKTAGERGEKKSVTIFKNEREREG